MSHDDPKMWHSGPQMAQDSTKIGLMWAKFVPTSFEVLQDELTEALLREGEAPAVGHDGEFSGGLRRARSCGAQYKYLILKVLY